MSLRNRKEEMMKDLTPLQMEIKKILSVLKADRTAVTDKLLSVTPIEERPDWLEAIGDIESYLRNFERNQKIIQAYARHQARKQAIERE